MHYFSLIELFADISEKYFYLFLKGRNVKLRKASVIFTKTKTKTKIDNGSTRMKDYQFL
jgi:hypothetical protein